MRLCFIMPLAAVALCASPTSAGGHPLDDVPWIGDGQPERNGADWYDEDPAPEFMAEFVLPEGVTETKIHFACAGFGFFSTRSAHMLPDDALWSVYDKTIYSTTTRALKATPVLNAGTSMAGFDLETYPATNRVHVWLGNGFYNLPPLRFWGAKCFRESLAHGRPCFKLSIDGVDKPLEWKWRETSIVRNSVYLGVEVDAARYAATVRGFMAERREPWKPAATVKGPKGKFVEWPQDNPRMGTFDIHHGDSKWLKEGDVQVVDFGVNAAGVPSFTFRDEPRSNRIEIIYGERLNADGTVNPLTQTAGQIKSPGMGGPGAPDLACQRDVYICRGPLTLPPMTVTSADPRAETFRPQFTWHVFRFAEIRGAKHLVTHARRDVRSMLPSCFSPHEAKDFKTDNPDLAAIHEICRRTFQANMIGGVQSDCPGRERLGYGGDIVATYEAYMMNWDMREIYLKILRDFADEAEDDGWLTETAPYVGIADRGFGGRSGPISWSLAVPELMDGILRHYNDKRALDFYPVCARYVRLVAEKCPDGLVPNCIGDHEALERAPNGCTATAHWHRFVELTAKFAKMLGRTDDEKEFTALAEKIRGAFAAAYVKDGVVANGTQSAQAIGLYLGLVPEAQRKAALARLVAAVEEKGCGPTTGIFSTRYMLMYLSEHGRVDLARKIVLHKGFPGWLHMIERGATTLWETWKESDNIYSNCHPMFGSVDEWILKYGKSAGEASVAMPDVDKIELPGEYNGHLQDVWYDGDGSLYWAHTSVLLKTDLKGNIVAKAEVSGHHAGIEARDGKVYVAVCDYQNKTGGKTLPSSRVTINVYDAATLKLLEEHVTDINDRSGSLCMLDDGSFVVGCLRPQDISPTQVRFHHIGKDYKLIKSYVLDNVPVKLGIETIKRRNGFLYLSHYLGGGLCIKLDKDFKEVSRFTFNGSFGYIFDGDKVWVGASRKNEGTGCYSSSLKRISSPDGF